MCGADCWIRWKKHIVNRRQSSASLYRKEVELSTYFWEHKSQNGFLVH